MGYTIGNIPAGRIVDASTKLEQTVLDAVSAAGYMGVARYVPLPGVSAAKDIDATELSLILGAGLGLLLVQHCRYPNWNPANASGSQDAAVAVEHASAAGYAKGSHIFVDLEGVLLAATATDTLSFVNAWAEAVTAAGYLAGCYVGYDVPLTADQLYYGLPRINSYWSDAGPRAVAVRGFAIKQEAELVIGGVKFDPDSVQPDGRGETPVWTVDATGQAPVG